VSAASVTDWSEDDWEDEAMEILAELGWETATGPEITTERGSWSELTLGGRLRDAVVRLNPQLPSSAVDDVIAAVTTPTSRDAVAENRRVHEFLTRGVRSVMYTDDFGAEHNPTVRLMDMRDVRRNTYLAVRQVTVVDGEHKRRFDIVLFLNGMPVAFIELKKAGDERADLAGARAQLDTYLQELPLAFAYGVVCVVTDGITARYGTAFTPFEHFAPWNVDEHGSPVTRLDSDEDLPINLMLRGLFNRWRFVELLDGYVAFSDAGDGLQKRVAKAHQYFAVARAVRKTVEAQRSDGRIGVVWHTQGSGKSMEMELYTFQVMRHPALANPTILVLTDRLDLDNQLFDTFQASMLLPEQPQQVASRDALRTELKNRTSGGIIFSTLQKFSLGEKEPKHPLLSERRNIIVIVDEAHRGHYDDLNGYARHLRDALPHASFIAFTGTPISETDRNTRRVFGPYIDVYDLTRAVTDGATVRVFHDSRLIPVRLPKDLDPEAIDERVDAITVGVDDAERDRIQRNVAVMNAVYGAPARLDTLARDIVEHWEERSTRMRQYLDGPGKGMIVCTTRHICADVYERIIALRPSWHDDAVDRGRIKVICSGTPAEKDPLIRKHLRRNSQNKILQKRLKDPDDDLELVIVQNMLLTGYDSPPLHTMYMDRPMRGAALMQALARVNRTFRGKEDGLLVGYAPLTESLNAAIAEYTADDQETRPLGHDLHEAVAEVRTVHKVVCQILAGYDWRTVLAPHTKQAIRHAIRGTINFLRDPAQPGNQVPNGEPSLADRFRVAARHLDRLWALCSSSGELNPLRDDIAFFDAVRIWMAKFDAEDRRARGLPIPAEITLYLKQLTAGLIESGGITDVYAAAGIDKPDLSRLNEEYLARLRASSTPTLTIEALRRAIEQQMRRITRHNLVRQRTFSDRLIGLMNRYTNQALSSAEILAELVALAHDVTAEGDRGGRFSPPLTSDEMAFYDAVSQNESAVREMSQGQLADIARDLVTSIRRSVSIDWMSRDDVRARLRSTIKRLLAKHGYPPDAEREAIDRVIEQMEHFAEDWSPDADQ
jgi:type I restriction enzyme R subunit